MARDWMDWHSAYDDPASPLSHRLVIVQRLVRDALDSAPPGPVRVLSLCAGDARDIAGAARDHPRARDISGALIEIDERLARDATANVAVAGVALDVRCGDAADPAGFADVLPADVLLLVGIFGNISDDDVAATVAAVPALCRSGATVIWTRHRGDPDLTPMIRQWFDRAGCVSVAFHSPGVGSFAIGSERLSESRRPPILPSRLFAFRDDLW
jgi:hypothetical protein